MIPDVSIPRGLQSYIGHMLCHVALRSDPSRERRWKLRIDQEAHLGGRKHGMIQLPCGVLQSRDDIPRFEVWVVGQDFSVARPRGQQVQNVRNPDPKPTEAGTPATLFWIYSNSMKFAHDASALLNAFANSTRVRPLG